jgi:hypothetical protein
MTLENFFEKLIDKSAAMRALRKSAGKAIVMGMLDALQAPGNAAGLDPAELAGEGGELGLVPANDSPKPGVALPRPQLLGIAGKQEEPDRPGIPPKRVRKTPSRAAQPPQTLEQNGEVQGPPAPPPSDAEGEKK